MINIAIYFESSESTGGVNRVASVIASALCDRGYNVHFISRYKGRKGLFTDDKRIVYHQLFNRFYSKYVTFIVEAIKVREIVKEHNIDYLISAGGIFFGIAQFCACKHIMWDHVSFWHGNYIQQFFRRLAAYKADIIVTLTQDNCNAFKSIKGCNARVVKINNPAFINNDKNINLKDRCKVVISLGYLGPQKGYDLLLKAWALLPLELQEEWGLMIAGEDEGDLSLLNQIVDQMQLKNVSFLGFRSDVDCLLTTSSIYVMSSRWEGMPMVLLEAQSYGLPIVSFDCKTGPSEIVNSNCGILVPPEDIRELSQALSQLMNDDCLRMKMSYFALENVKRFAIDNIINQWENMFN